MCSSRSGRRSESRGARAGGEVGAVDLEDGERCVSVDLLTRRSARTAVAEVVSKGLLQLHVLETELADPQFALLPVLVRLGRIVPAQIKRRLCLEKRRTGVKTKNTREN